MQHGTRAGVKPKAASWMDSQNERFKPQHASTSVWLTCMLCGEHRPMKIVRTNSAKLSTLECPGCHKTFDSVHTGRISEGDIMI